MLPILRILPVGGVLLAILILVLALSPPDGSRSPLAGAIAPARGALVDREHHPEWRQFLILAAVRRADELNRLRDLPDTPTRFDIEPETPQVAAIPSDQIEAEPDEAIPVIEAPAASPPVEIREPSSTELPVTAQEEKPPQVVSQPERTKPVRETRRRKASRVRAAANPRVPSQLNLLELLFGPPQYQQQRPYTSYSAQQPNPPPPYRTADPPY
jgi:hypothetical protein